jgi:predicted LPLAT superfamily acyltransferase
MHWSSVSERGGIIGMRVLFATYRLFGRGAFNVLLYPVAAYFCVAARGARDASKHYLARVRERLRATGRSAPGPLTTFAHIVQFGHAVLDKGAMWAGAFERFRRDGRGALFIGSHLGNLEVLRAFGDVVQGLKVNALVFTRHSPKFNRVLASVSPRALDRLIQVDSLGPDTVAMLADKLRDGEHVAIVADRVSVNYRERSIYAPFLGLPAPFPEGPFILASLLGCPVYLLFCASVAAIESSSSHSPIRSRCRVRNGARRSSVR